MCNVVGNMSHDIQFVEVHDLTTSHCRVLKILIDKNSNKSLYQIAKLELQYLKTAIHIQLIPKYHDNNESGDKHTVLVLLGKLILNLQILIVN